MGICNAPATFQRAMNMAFAKFVNKTRLTQPLINFCVIVYMDDILFFSKTYEYHVEHVEWVLHALKDAGFKVALEKSEFFLSEISFLGYIVTVDGLKPDPRKVAAVREAPAPVTLTQVRAFLGLASYYRCFIRSFASLSKPLANLLKKEEQLIWTPECEAAFRALKEALTSAPVLARPDPTRQFALHTDWQSQVILAVLTQQGTDGREHVIEYASKTLSQAQSNYEVCKDRLLRHQFNEERQLRYDIQQVNVPAPGAADLAAYSLLCDRLTYAGVYVDVTQLPGRETTRVFIEFRALQVAPNFVHSVATFIGDLTILPQPSRELARSFVREYAVQAARSVARVQGRGGHRFTAHEALLRRAEDGPIAEEEEIQPRLRTATAPRRTYHAVLIPDYIAQREERLEDFPEEKPLRPPSSYPRPAPPKAPKKTPKRKRRHPSPGAQGSRIGGGEEVVQPVRAQNLDLVPGSAATLVKETVVPSPPFPRVPDLNLNGARPSAAAAGGGSRMGLPDPVSRTPVLVGPFRFRQPPRSAPVIDISSSSEPDGPSDQAQLAGTLIYETGQRPNVMYHFLVFAAQKRERRPYTETHLVMTGPGPRSVRKRVVRAVADLAPRVLSHVPGAFLYPSFVQHRFHEEDAPTTPAAMAAFLPPILPPLNPDIDHLL
ncbi:hypothetical protein CBR_g48733 [Chara braunii]|uniref:Reverse transcriptase domain-containing protein n=1 Tax=Chara braunii TaxID=69332 RepID=A0A388K4K5_CHABU|nr:hypothetical protein CBR_g48733 [Chara braunii]|eukprot:GBG64984.1 hypothetical protein CBR_g48733 [Chara braunii]